MRRTSKLALARLGSRATVVAFSAATLLASSGALADESLIKNPGDHPSYRFELEPHGLLGYGYALRGHNAHVGTGMRGTVIIVDNGFVPSINNSVGIGFGGDIFFDHNPTIFLPVVMQWNFWLSTHWSVFGEPGLGFALNTHDDVGVIHPVFYAGGRFHFNERISLTLRGGYPYFSVGVSFLL